jgi:hypothetical protein
MLSVTFDIVLCSVLLAECCYAEYYYAESHHAECRYAECRGTLILYQIVLNLARDKHLGI